MRACGILVLGVLVGCSSGEGSDDTSGGPGPVTLATEASGTTGAPVTTGGPSSSSTGDAGDSDTPGTSTEPNPTTSTADPTTGTSDATTDDATTTGGFMCDPNAVADTLAFSYVSKFDTGLPDKVLQASYYNTVADEVMIMSFSGSARRFKTDGTPLSDVFAVPAEALPQLDGATFDAVLKRGLLINQSCVLTEVEPQSLAVISSQQLGFGMSVCAGLALGLDGNLYIASYGTNELVVLSRDGAQEVRRINMIDKVGLTGFDGIALIAGSENFLVMSTNPKADAAIIDPLGNVVVPVAALGQGSPPMIGGMPMLPDAVLTICGNGHAWVCEAYDATCFDYAPDDGDKNACACLIPG
jgi:hypothetical protein